LHLITAILYKVLCSLLLSILKLLFKLYNRIDLIKTSLYAFSNNKLYALDRVEILCVYYILNNISQVIIVDRACCTVRILAVMLAVRYHYYS
jgi:hypothetical protein